MHQFLSNIAQTMIKHEQEKWPPDSPFGIYQPYRPNETTVHLHNEDKKH